MKKKLLVLLAISLLLASCTVPNERPRYEDEDLEQNQEENRDTASLETKESYIFQQAEVKSCRITADNVDVRSGPGNNYDAIGKLNKSDEVGVLAQLGNWYVVQLANSQIGVIDSANAQPIVKENGGQTAQQPTNVPPTQQQTQTQENTTQEKQPARDNITENTGSNRLSSQEQQMVELVNRERAKNNLPALQVDFEVVKVARIKSQDMVDNNYFSHNSVTYGSPFDMLKQFGVEFLYAGENLAGNSTVSKAHEALMNSSGHRQNILGPNFTHIGIGIRPSDKYGYIFTQMFIGKNK